MRGVSPVWLVQSRWPNSLSRLHIQPICDEARRVVGKYCLIYGQFSRIKDCGIKIKLSVFCFVLWENERFTLIIFKFQIDICPNVRGHVWSALLGVRGDTRGVYSRIDKCSRRETDRQIEVDIPRCHQYEPLISCPEGARKLKSTGRH